MPIVRGSHSFDKQFTQIPNAWVRDTRLSLKAIGLLAQLMSHSIGWNVSIRSLAEANGCGLDFIRSAVAELESVGYLVRLQERDGNGRFGETTWQTCDPSDSPTPENPTPVNPTPKNTSSKEEQSKEIHGVREAFEAFWEVYPRKAGKQAAAKAFHRACVALGGPSKLLEGAKAYRDDPNRVEAYTAHAASWLNAGRWDDEPLPERPKSFKDKFEEERAVALSPTTEANVEKAWNFLYFREQSVHTSWSELSPANRAFLVRSSRPSEPVTSTYAKIVEGWNASGIDAPETARSISEANQILYPNE